MYVYIYIYLYKQYHISILETGISCWDHTNAISYFIGYHNIYKFIAWLPWIHGLRIDASSQTGRDRKSWSQNHSPRWKMDLSQFHNGKKTIEAVVVLLVLGNIAGLNDVECYRAGRKFLIGLTGVKDSTNWWNNSWCK